MIKTKLREASIKEIEDPLVMEDFAKQKEILILEGGVTQEMDSRVKLEISVRKCERLGIIS